MRWIRKKDGGVAWCATIAGEGVQKLAGFVWDKRRILGAQLVADDLLTNEQIAARCSVIRQTLDKWKRHPEFMARVEARREAFRARIEAEGIANRQNRIAAQNERWHLMQRVIAERGADPTMAGVPGGKTGLLVRTYKVLGTGESAERVEEYRVDAGTLRELREHEKQAAQELGQWAEEAQNGGAGEASPLVVLRQGQGRGGGEPLA